MFELSIALKYLIPRWRQLSVSIISIISILVISLVVWLVVVFFSVTHGLEKGWIEKLIALTAPIRITPTDAYYQSYYYQVDSHSADSNYNFKSIGEKKVSPKSDPYNPEEDSELPAQWAAADRYTNGDLKDPVKAAFTAIAEIKDIDGLKAADFEVAAASMKLQLFRELPDHQVMQSNLSQAGYVGSIEKDNGTLLRAIQPITLDDLNHLLSNLSLSHYSQEDGAKRTDLTNSELQQQLYSFFSSIQIEHLRTLVTGWILPKSLLPQSGKLQGHAIYKNGKIDRIILPQTIKADHPALIEIDFSEAIPAILVDGQKELISPSISYLIEGGVELSAQLIDSSLLRATEPKDVLFQVNLVLQDTVLAGTIPMGTLELGTAVPNSTISEKATSKPLWSYQELKSNGEKHLILPTTALLGNAVLIPKNFREAGIHLGDRGYLIYFAPTTSSVQEQRVPIYIAGYYDPGIIPIGGKFILADQEVTSLLRSSLMQEDNHRSNGINVRFTHLEKADEIKAAILQAFEKAEIAPYWKVETYREFEFTKDLIQQLHSERNLWTLIATVIILVACSNIVSMLIILVNDKKLEIGILRSMGASTFSIALIFGICGMVMGMLGSIFGVLFALVTLKNLQALVDIIGEVQGHEMFNPIFYGNSLPNEISFDALLFVIITTTVVSIIAGIVPAIKACLLRPSAILRSE